MVLGNRVWPLLQELSSNIVSRNFLLCVLIFWSVFLLKLKVLTDMKQTGTWSLMFFGDGAKLGWCTFTNKSDHSFVLLVVLLWENIKSMEWLPDIADQCESVSWLPFHFMSVIPQSGSLLTVATQNFVCYCNWLNVWRSGCKSEQIFLNNNFKRKVCLWYYVCVCVSPNIFWTLDPSQQPCRSNTNITYCTVHRLRDGEASLLICLPLLHMPKQLWVSVCTASLLYNSSESWCYTETVVECSQCSVPPPQLPCQLTICGQYGPDILCCNRSVKSMLRLLVCLFVHCITTTIWH
jgi:hypothetical protein